jgi:NADH-quinone oxidoreductase chain G
MIKIEINNIEFWVDSNISVLEACKYVGITVPRFCYHETLSVAGNCRMCLVEIGNSPKPVASCAFPVSNNIKILVDTPLVKKARENVIETLLLNHPLDCPICDQAGECDLQDQTKTFGGDFTRYVYNKRGVEDKNCGVLIKTIMTRCIHCTRCVRFGSEIAGVDILGTLNRGGSTEIGNYVSTDFNSEISGNVIDLCPVGALTSKPYAFKARPWELKTTESIDLTDSTGSNIYVNFKESEILRILPKITNYINDNIISDKARFSHDANTKNRSTSVLKLNSPLSKSNWSEIFSKIEMSLIQKKKLTFLVDNSLDFESLAFIKLFTFKYKNVNAVSLDSTSSNIFISWLNDKIDSLKRKSNLCFIITSNVRIESAIINSKLRIKFSSEDLAFYGLGLNYNSNYNINFINLNVKNIISILEAKNIVLSRLFLNNVNPIICVGENLFKRGFEYNTLVTFLKNINPTTIVLNINSGSNGFGSKILNLSPLNQNVIKESDILIAFNVNENYKIAFLKGLKKEILWFTTHNPIFIQKSVSYIVPILSSFEEEQLHINLEERVQKTSKILPGISQMRSVKFFLSTFFDNDNKINDIYAYIYEMISFPNKFNLINNIFNLNYLRVNKNLIFKNIQYFPIKSNIEDFYHSNKFTKNSLVMSQCSQNFRKAKANF